MTTATGFPSSGIVGLFLFAGIPFHFVCFKVITKPGASMYIYGLNIRTDV